MGRLCMDFGYCSLQLNNNFTISCNKMCADCIICSRVEERVSLKWCISKSDSSLILIAPSGAWGRT